ncbi:hypothetical protein [Streptosporangium roseum]|uniref:hypothetical protein n=1 Tax=Streptosporangium roseum TaxID=2001 RepID=UPI0001A3D7BF|nr:hypothetical protein [Streptosporangium roseum]
MLFSPGFRRLERIAIRTNLLLARTRLLGVTYRSSVRDLPGDARRDMRREGFTGTVVRTHAVQARTFLDELATWRANPPDLGGIPVTVISGGLPGIGMPSTLRAAANASHARRAARSADGRHVIAERSGHYVPVTEPGIVVDEIFRLAEPGRGRARARA